MSEFRTMAGILLTIFAMSTTNLSYAESDDMTLHQELERVANLKIFFGHQSVGINLLDGIKKLSVTSGVPLHIVELKSANEVGKAMIAQTFLAENGYPLKKISNFQLAFGPKQSNLDVALMKFCFIDFTANTDAKSLFASYKTSIEALQSKNPGTTFVHVTAPLTIVEGGLKARIKHFLNLAPLYGTIENLRREEYNKLIRETYMGREPVFDLARIESTAKSGKVETVKWDGINIPVLTPGYSSDGGHLNDSGKIVAARELVSVLASIQKQKSSK